MSELGRLPKDYLNIKVSEGKVTRADADLILEHLDEQTSDKGMSDSTNISNVHYLEHAVENIPDTKTWTTQKISSYVAGIRKRYKANTQRKHIILLKRFCNWIVSNGKNSNIDIAKIDGIKATPADRMTKTSAMMLRDEDVSKIITAGRNTRDRCMISMLAESGMRPFELLNLTWGELQIDNKGVIINVSGKTKVPRFIRLVHSTPYIAAWRNDHPSPKNNHHIFVSLRGEDVSGRVTHMALRKVVRRAAKRAGIEKHVNPYLFRHSNVSRMLEEGYSDSTIRMVHWGSQTTTMLGTYGHVSNQAVDNEILDKAGVIRVEKKERKPVNQCSGCYTILTPTQKFCPACGLPQTEDAKQEKETYSKNIDALSIENLTDQEIADAVRRRYKRKSN
jgi:integrase